MGRSVVIFGFIPKSNFWRIFDVFLGHRSRRLQSPIVITRCPASVRRPSSVVRRPSLDFHILNFFSRTAWWILMKLGRDEVLMVLHKCCCFSARSAKGQKWSKSMWEEILLFLVPFRSQIFDAFLTSFGLSHFGIFSCNFYEVLCSEVLNLHLLCAVYMYISYAV